MFLINYLNGSDTFSQRNYTITKILKTKTNVIKVLIKTMFRAVGARGGQGGPAPPLNFLFANVFLLVAILKEP